MAETSSLRFHLRQSPDGARPPAERPAHEDSASLSGSRTAARRPEPVRALTALRGLAAWWVVAFHFREALPAATPAFIVAIIDRGYLAVDLFFILSGYVIALNYATWFSGDVPKPGGTRRFLALRLSRVYPVHLVMLLLFLIDPVAVWIVSGRARLGDLHAGYYGLSFLLMQNWGIVPGLHWNVPAWSISAEWLAYLLFPLLAAPLVRISGTWPRALLCGAALLGLLAVVAEVCSPSGLGSGGQLFWLARCVIEFSAGIVLYRIGLCRNRTPGETNAALAFALACIAVFAAAPVPDFVVMPLAFAALVHGFADERGRIAAALRSRPLQWLGLVSYSTYMAHYLIKGWTKFVFLRPGVPAGLAFPAYVAAVLIASWLLFTLVERPAQAMLRRCIDGSAARA